MKIEEQVCSLELAKKLKELGAKQESEWIWAIMNIGAGQSAYIYNTVGDKGYHRDVEYSAYTVAELGERINKSDYNPPRWDGSGWVDENDLNVEYSPDLSEADARAEFWRVILKNELLNT